MDPFLFQNHLPAELYSSTHRRCFLNPIWRSFRCLSLGISSLFGQNSVASRPSLRSGFAGCKCFAQPGRTESDPSPTKSSHLHLLQPKKYRWNEWAAKWSSMVQHGAPSLIGSRVPRSRLLHLHFAIVFFQEDLRLTLPSHRPIFFALRSFNFIQVHSISSNRLYQDYQLQVPK